MKRRFLLLTLAAFAVPLATDDDACADHRAGAPQKTLEQKLRSGDDLAKAALYAAVFDGMWSLYTNYATELTLRAFDAPYGWGTARQYSPRLLYGLSWTAMLAVESFVLLASTHGTFEWLAEATYRTDWMIGIDAPACPRPGAFGGCGTGAGNFAFLMFRPRGSNWWFEAGGGWLQQRILDDPYRTVNESEWVLTPIAAAYQVKTKVDAPVAFFANAGPGLYFGLHAGHMHETLKGRRDKDLEAPLHGMYVLDGGIGPGARLETRIVFARRLSLEGQLVVAPFLLGGPVGDRPSSEIAPLDFERQGTSTWRWASAGIGWRERGWPVWPVVSAFALELSDRPIERVGHRGIMLRFDIPLREGAE